MIFTHELENHKLHEAKILTKCLLLVTWCRYLLTFVFQTANPCKEIQDSLGFHAVQDSWFSVFVSGTWIPDSLSCIPDCKAQDSGFHLKILLDLGFQNPDSLTGGKNGLWTDFLYYNRTTSLHVQRTFQLTSEYHYWRMLQIHLASSDPRVSKSTY